MRGYFRMAMRSLARRTGGRSALAIAAAAILAGTAISQQAAAMVGGAPIAATEYGRSVVMILGSSGTACTATAIGRNLLLTAAHCVQPGSDYKLVGSKSGEPPVLKAIARIERHPQFEMQRLLNHLATADVALVKLAEPLPSRVMPARIGGATALGDVGDTLVVAGYGVTVRGDGRTGGTARAAALSVTGQPGLLQIRLFDPATKGVNAGLGACAGDSGAPAFRSIAGEARIIGVVSWSTGPNLTAGCGGPARGTALVEYPGRDSDTPPKPRPPLVPLP